MLAFNGAIRTWHVSNVTDMRLGKYRLFELAKDYFADPYNGDCLTLFK